MTKNTRLVILPPKEGRGVLLIFPILVAMIVTGTALYGIGAFIKEDMPTRRSYETRVATGIQEFGIFLVRMAILAGILSSLI